jgi:hypothetical protein
MQKTIRVRLLQPVGIVAVQQLLNSSLPLHVAHVHCGSHYSVRSLYQQLLQQS